MIIVIAVLLALILIALVFGGDSVATLFRLGCGCLVLLAIPAAIVFIGFAVFG